MCREIINREVMANKPFNDTIIIYINYRNNDENVAK